MGEAEGKVNAEPIKVRRKTSEGSHVGIDSPDTPEKTVEWLKHLYAYEFAKSFAEGNYVLDIGCGSGYGVDRLSFVAGWVLGLDIWRDGIYFAHNRSKGWATYLLGSGSYLPLKDQTIGLVVSFQVIEHIPRNWILSYLGEISRVLRAGGNCILVTPNRKLRLLRFQKPWDQDHVTEYDARELETTLRRVFTHVEVFGLSARTGSYLVEYNRVKQNPWDVYFLSPITWLVSRGLPLSIARRITRAISARNSPERKLGTDMSSDYALGDFRILKSDLRSCLDLYAVCQKS